MNMVTPEPLTLKTENIDCIGTSGRLKGFIERIERLEEEKNVLGADIREIFAEAKGYGFDTTVMRQILRLRKMQPADLAEADFLLGEYRKILGF